MSAIAERWIDRCPRELLDCTLFWSQAYLRRVLRQYEAHHNQHRPHPISVWRRTPEAATGPVNLDHYRVRDTSPSLT
jgi:hypothetical protein